MFVAVYGVCGPVAWPSRSTDLTSLDFFRLGLSEGKSLSHVSNKCERYKKPLKIITLTAHTTETVRFSILFE